MNKGIKVERSFDNITYFVSNKKEKIEMVERDNAEILRLLIEIRNKMEKTK